MGSHAMLQSSSRLFAVVPVLQLAQIFDAAIKAKHSSILALVTERESSPEKRMGDAMNTQSPMPVTKWAGAELKSLDEFLMFVDWLWFHVRKEHEVQQCEDGGHRQRIRLANGLSVVASYDQVACKATVESDLEPSFLSPLLQQALDRARGFELCPPSWWEGRLQTSVTSATTSMLQMMRSADQHRRYEGTWRLSQDALVTFEQKVSADARAFPALFPSQEIWVRFRVCGVEGGGPAALREAVQKFSAIRAILSFITGSPLESASSMIVSMRQPAVSEAESLRESGAAQELGVQGYAVWSFLIWQHQSGAFETFDRSLNAMRAFAFGMSQPTVEAATMFFVTAIEALNVPNRGWQLNRVTRRFVEFLTYLCEEKLCEILKHANFEEAFGQCASPQKFAELLYKLRSKPAHSGNFGLDPGLTGPGSTVIHDAPAVMLIADLVQTAIVNFLVKPASSLCGHPNFDGELKVELSAAERAEIFERANARRSSVQEVLRSALFG